LGVGHAAWGMGLEAWGMRYGAWGVRRGAWGVGRGAVPADLAEYADLNQIKPCYSVNTPCNSVVKKGVMA